MALDNQRRVDGVTGMCAWVAPLEKLRGERSARGRKCLFGKVMSESDCVSNRSKWFRLVPFGSVSFRFVPFGAGSFRMVPGGAGLCPLAKRMAGTWPLDTAATAPGMAPGVGLCRTWLLRFAAQTTAPGCS